MQLYIIYKLGILTDDLNQIKSNQIIAYSHLEGSYGCICTIVHIALILIRVLWHGMPLGAAENCHLLRYIAGLMYVFDMH